MLSHCGISVRWRLRGSLAQNQFENHCAPPLKAYCAGKPRRMPRISAIVTRCNRLLHLWRAN